MNRRTKVFLWIRKKTGYLTPSQKMHRDGLLIQDALRKGLSEGERIRYEQNLRIMKDYQNG